MEARQLLLPVAIAALSACAQPTPAPAPAPSPSPVAGACNAQAGQFAVGQAGTAELGERAMRAAGAQQYRFLRPGQAVTLEYNAGRLNLELDAAGKVLRVRCG